MDHDLIIIGGGAAGSGAARAGQWSNLWSIDIETKEETRLTEGDRRIGAFAVSPAGDRVVFTSRTENRRNQQNLSEIHLLDVASGEVRQLTENQAPESRLASWESVSLRIPPSSAYAGAATTSSASRPVRPSALQSSVSTAASTIPSR